MDPRRPQNRLLDSSLNRAAEGLRVAEDVCRFRWSLAGFAGELKALRHELLAAGRGDLEIHRELLRARDSEGDVGRASGFAETAAGGETDDDLARAAFSNLERAREAIRTLEEVSRRTHPALAGRFESIRYRLYSIEKGLGCVDDRGGRSPRLAHSRLYLLATSRLCRAPLLETIEEAVAAGVDIVQLREKTASSSELLRQARAAREITARGGALFVVNDRPDVAILSHADGIHLGQDDLPVAEARSLLGEDVLIGVSTHSPAEARRAAIDGADYIGAGPVFATRTKDAGPAIGTGGLGGILAAGPLPSFAIGGITADNIREVIAAGARRVAVSSAVLSSRDVAETVRRLRDELGTTPL